MSTNPLPSVDQTIYAVREWKETLDPYAPWWRRWFHRFVYLPFNEFSLRVMKVPTCTSATVVGNEVRLSWLEDAGFFGSEHEADLACLTERFSYQGLPYGRLFPCESGQSINPTIFPRARNPRKRARPVLSLVMKDLKQEESEREQLASYLTQINQVLDR